MYYSNSAYAAFIFSRGVAYCIPVYTVRHRTARAALRQMSVGSQSSVSSSGGGILANNALGSSASSTTNDTDARESSNVNALQQVHLHRLLAGVLNNVFELSEYKSLTGSG